MGTVSEFCEKEPGSETIPASSTGWWFVSFYSMLPVTGQVHTQKNPGQFWALPSENSEELGRFT